MCYGTDIWKTYIFFQAPSIFSEITIEHYRLSNTNFGICRYWQLDLHCIALLSSQDIWSLSRNHCAKFTQIWFRIQYGIYTNSLSILRINAVQRHLSYSFLLWTKDGYSNWAQTITKFQMREVYTYKQLNCYWYTPWKIGELRRSRLLLLTSNFSKLFSRAASIEGRLADGLSTENCFFARRGLTGTNLFLLFPGLDTDRLQQRRPSLLYIPSSSTYCTTPTSTTSEMWAVVRCAASPTADDATVSVSNQRSRLSLTAFLRDTIFSRHDFKSAIMGPVSTPIAPQGSNLELCRTASAAVTAVFSILIPVSEKKVSLRE